MDIPEGVDPDLVQKLESVQRQICILIRNHNILTTRSDEDPENEAIRKQIEIVENHLLHFGKQQRPIIEEIRKEIKHLKSKTEVKPEPQVQQEENEDIKANVNEESTKSKLEEGNDDKEKKEEATEDKENVKEPEPRKTTSKKGGKITNKIGTRDEVCRMNMKRRMALVRAQKTKKRRKMGNTSNSVTPKGESPNESRENSLERELLGRFNFEKEGDPDDVEAIPQSQYKGYVSEMEKKSYDKSDFDWFYSYAEHLVDPISLREETFQKTDQDNFLLHLGLLPPPKKALTDQYQSTLREVKNKYRNMTYVPELREKKLKDTYNWLSSELLSPPLLRTRRRRSNNLHRNPSDEAKNSTSASFVIGDGRKTPPSDSNSRTPTPTSKDEREEGTEGDDEAEADEGLQDEMLVDEMLPHGNNETPSCFMDDVEQDEFQSKDIVMDEVPQNGQVGQCREEKRSRKLTEKTRSKVLKNMQEAEKHIQKLTPKLKNIEENFRTTVKGTIATRKERLRQNELLVEKEEVEAKMEKFKQVLNKCKQQLTNSPA